MVVMHVWMSISWVLKYSGEGWRINRGSREAETSGDFGRE